MVLLISLGLYNELLNAAESFFLAAKDDLRVAQVDEACAGKVLPCYPW